MTRISDYSDGGVPQSADEFIIERTGVSKKIKWSSIRAYLDSVYSELTSSGLVTNGNSHNHSGGDGEQINHLLMSNVGANYHSEIDTHIALPRWTTVIKQADETVSNDTSTVIDSELTFTATVGKKYAVRGALWFYSSAAAGFSFGEEDGGILDNGNYTVVGYDVGGTTQKILNFRDPGGDLYLDLNGAASGIGFLRFSARYECFGVTNYRTRWWPTVAVASPTTVYKGSYIEYYEIP